MAASNKKYTRARKLLRRKLLLGLAASYREIAERIGTTSHATVRAVLTETETDVSINREKILDQVEKVISEIEAEQDLEAAA